MKKKTLGVLICMLLIITVSSAASFTDKNNNNQSNNEIDGYEGYRYDPFPECPVMTNPPERLDPDGASPKPRVIDTPDEFSWKDYNGLDWTTPAKNQGYCGSCWDFAAIGTLESIINIRERSADLDPDLSEQYVLSCLPYAGSCGGGNAYAAFWYIMDTSENGNYHNGIIPETCFPYQADDDVPCSDKCADWEDKLAPILDFGYWQPDGSPGDREAIKTQLMQDGPLVTYIMATDDFKEWGLTHHSPEDYYPYHSASYINHVVSLVGWKDDPAISHGGYWIVKNSWGKFWGYDGFFNIEYGSLHIDDYQIVWVNYSEEDFNWPPVGDASGPYHGDVGQEIIFNGSGSFDPENNITSYHWDFGDGANDTGVTTTHSYSQRGVYTVTLTVTDENGKQSTDETAAIIDLWLTDDKWKFKIDNMSLQLAQDGQSLSLQGSVDELLVTVGNDDGDYYQLDFKGEKMIGDFAFGFDTDVIQIQGSGRILKFTTIDGNIRCRQSDIGIEHINARIIGIMMLKIDKFPIPLPIPFRITVEANFSTAYTVFDFPLTSGKQGDFPSTDITIDATIGGIFGIIRKTFTYDLEIPPIPYVCMGEEEITVEAGTYNAYNISIAEIMSYHFAPAAGNIIKVSAKLEDYFTLHGELISTNYEQ